MDDEMEEYRENDKKKTREADRREKKKGKREMRERERVRKGKKEAWKKKSAYVDGGSEAPIGGRRGGNGMLGRAKARLKWEYTRQAVPRNKRTTGGAYGVIPTIPGWRLRNKTAGVTNSPKATKTRKERQRREFLAVRRQPFCHLFFASSTNNAAFALPAASALGRLLGCLLLLVAAAAARGLRWEIPSRRPASSTNTYVHTFHTVHTHT
ncbi:uncharacterized protein CIMG_12080 [Coccidioides immitis RS]|uniref:Uncharacterized protein n=1 Tax=Coccidioides immitis (strain RS) TaxID=246410 RepID=A0A0D8JU19_COCIM|nr:uncharacterized protein CIMG_12080 [Coccidioides immitis RS]KJF60845.1 hypothetical protein CIMG_12080 [Coccidioides immitis RS]